MPTHAAYRADRVARQLAPRVVYVDGIALEHPTRYSRLSSCSRVSTRPAFCASSCGTVNSRGGTDLAASETYPARRRIDGELPTRIVVDAAVPAYLPGPSRAAGFH